MSVRNLSGPSLPGCCTSLLTGHSASSPISLYSPGSAESPGGSPCKNVNQIALLLGLRLSSGSPSHSEEHPDSFPRFPSPCLGFQIPFLSLTSFTNLHTQTFLLFFELIPASGPLHLLFPLSGMLVLEMFS